MVPLAGELRARSTPGKDSTKALIRSTAPAGTLPFAALTFSRTRPFTS